MMDTKDFADHAWWVSLLEGLRTRNFDKANICNTCYWLQNTRDLEKHSAPIHAGFYRVVNESSYEMLILAIAIDRSCKMSQCLATIWHPPWAGADNLLDFGTVFVASLLHSK